ncbi:cytochrome P450 [Halostella pelagica]|uniref:cytochrome P450 n=1 Tax=Halostella pelagica TaxID=2583824 RepID=UPI00108193DD|nr:cytochrome P450 [Halostella pelagica]
MVLSGPRRNSVKTAHPKDGDMSETGDPPSPAGIPILGNGLAFSRDPVRAMESWATHGDLVRLRFMDESLYMVTHPELIKQILVEDQHKFTIGPEQQQSFEGIEDAAMTTATGERWKRLRRASHPAFTRESITSYGDRMAAVTARFIDEWDEGERFALHPEIRRVTVQILAETLLNEDIRGQEDVVIEAADAFVDRTNFRRPGQLLPDWIPTPTERRFRRAVQHLDTFVEDLVAERQYAETETNEDVCAMLLAAHEDGELTRTEVKQNLVAFLLTGHESPSGALTHVWYLLADHPDVYESLCEEYDQVVEGNRPTIADYDALEYTQYVVDETLRLYPPTTGINRQATESVTLDGYELPPAAQFLIPQWVPHRDKRFWDEPEKFVPDRWTRSVDRPEYAYFPFSGGPRSCIGADFARQELTLALATMVGHVTLDVTTDGPLTFIPSIQLRPATEITAEVHHR